MRRSAICLLLLGMLGARPARPAAGAVATGASPGAAQAASAAPGVPLDAGRAAAAGQLRRTERALAATAAAARGRAELARTAASARPFWGALDRLSRALQQADQGLRAADSSYFAAVGEGSRALAELEGVWARVPRRPPAVASRVAALSAAYRRLRNGYGWEALRRRQGGSLTPVEARRFRALRQADARVAATVKPVQAKAAKTGDAAMAAQLGRLRDQAQRVASAELTLEAYLTAELLNDIVQGEWAASQSYVRKPYRATYHKAASTIDKLATDPGVGFVFTADLSKAESWSFDAGSDESAAEPGAAAASVPGRTAAPAVDETPVDEVEIFAGSPRRTEGVAADPSSTAEGGADPAAEPAPAPVQLSAEPSVQAPPADAAGEAGTMREDPDVLPAAPQAPAEAPAAAPADPPEGVPPASVDPAPGDAAPQEPAETVQPPENPPPDAAAAPDPAADPSPVPPPAPAPAEPPSAGEPPPADENPLPIEPPEPPPAPPPAS